MTVILSWLLHHSNRDWHYHYKTEFYAIKNKILNKHGKCCGFDIQHIPGKKCYSCNGTGIYTGYYMDSGDMWQDTCHNCCGGWYKMPKYIILKKIKFGKYIFHQPQTSSIKIMDIKSVYFSNKKIIRGYIEHESSKYSKLASKVLFIIYDIKIYKLRYWKPLGVGFYVCWWKPKYYLNNIYYLYKRIMNNLKNHYNKDKENFPF